MSERRGMTFERLARMKAEYANNDDVLDALHAVEQLHAATQRVRDLHIKVENPRHGCCAAPKVCEGHAPECRSAEHPLGGISWPCATMRALGEY